MIYSGVVGHVRGALHCHAPARNDWNDAHGAIADHRTTLADIKIAAYGVRDGVARYDSRGANSDPYAQPPHNVAAAKHGVALHDPVGGNPGIEAVRNAQSLNYNVGISTIRLATHRMVIHPPTLYILLLQVEAA
jgi:hypothetical protein